MKKDIHPKYFSNATITCSCGNVLTVGSTVEKMKTELCSACHPFYTGKQKHVDSAGRIEKFMKKKEKAEEHSNKLKAEKEKLEQAVDTKKSKKGKKDKKKKNS